MEDEIFRDCLGYFDGGLNKFGEAFIEVEEYFFCVLGDFEIWSIEWLFGIDKLANHIAAIFDFFVHRVDGGLWMEIMSIVAFNVFEVHFFWFG